MMPVLRCRAAAPMRPKAIRVAGRTPASEELAVSHLRPRKDTPSPSRSSSAIEGLDDAGELEECAMPGGRGRFLQVAFYVSPASAQATPNHVRLVQARHVDLEPDKRRGGRARCGG
jgi:hypothetical protein